MIFLTAGHYKRDAGAIYNGRKEADETIRLRNAIATLLSERGVNVWKDNDDWNLSRTINEISRFSKPEDLVCDLHFNAGGPSATGCEVYIPDNANAGEMDIAKALVNTIASVLSIRNRGVKTERDSRHVRLGMMRPPGRNVLIEVCFISNLKDMQQYDAFFDRLVGEITRVLSDNI